MQIIYSCNQRVTDACGNSILSNTCGAEECGSGFACRPAWRPGLDNGSKPAVSTTGQLYLWLSASLGSQHSPVWPGTRAIKGNIRRYYKLLTRQTTRSLGSCFLPCFPSHSAMVYQPGTTPTLMHKYQIDSVSDWLNKRASIAVFSISLHNSTTFNFRHDNIYTSVHIKSWYIKISWL